MTEDKWHVEAHGSCSDNQDFVFQVLLVLSKEALHPVVEAEMYLDDVEEISDNQANDQISDAGSPVYHSDFVRMREWIWVWICVVSVENQKRGK